MVLEAGFTHTVTDFELIICELSVIFHFSS